MAVNKVEFGGETLMDLTEDTVTPETLAEGATAHDAAGNPIVGTLKIEQDVITFNVTDDTVTVADMLNTLQEEGVTISDLNIIKLTGSIEPAMLIMRANKYGDTVFNVYAVNLTDFSDMNSTNDYGSITISDFIDSFHKVQYETDLTLRTENKTVAGGINELYSLVNMKVPYLQLGASPTTLMSYVKTSIIDARLNGKWVQVDFVGGYTANFLMRIRNTGGPTNDFIEAVNLQTLKVVKMGPVDFTTLTISAALEDSEVSDSVIYQPKTDNTLNTEAKTIAGAINEVNGKTVDKVKSLDTYSMGATSVDMDDNGISWQDVFEFYDDRMLEGKSIGAGDILHKVPIAAGNNVEFEVDEINQVVKIHATGGGGSSNNTNDDTIVGVWKFNDIITDPCGVFDVPFVSDGRGFIEISSRSFILFYSNVAGDETEPAYNLLDNIWVDEAYKIITITEEPAYPDEFITWLKANAVKISTPGEMPQIRFVGMLGGPYIDEYNTVQFSIEISEGTVQVGDALQLCVMKVFGETKDVDGHVIRPRKKKLRMVAEYVIKEEDLEKKVIPLVLPMSNHRVRFFIKHTGTVGNSSLSPMYFRIRRPKGLFNIEANQGRLMTVDAEFSNIVTVWKTCERMVDDEGNELNCYKINII